MHIELGETIAERTFRVHDENGNETFAKVIFGMPRQMQDSDDVFVPYLIEALDRKKLWYMVGIDAFQAIQLALRVISSEIFAIENRYNVKFSWDGDDEGGLGFVD
ncbi:MAG TPA: hypothetical protein PKC65_03115 [Pyrinomonadaceae bacterium]|nr:hypothetical protein [Pyrinomonadaceae bacterium]